LSKSYDTVGWEKQGLEEQTSPPNRPIIKAILGVSMLEIEDKMKLAIAKLFGDF